MQEGSSLQEVEAFGKHKLVREKSDLLAHEGHVQFPGDFVNFRAKLICQIAGDKASQRQRAATEAVGRIRIGIWQIGIANKAASKRASHIGQGQTRTPSVTAVNHSKPGCMECAREKVPAAGSEVTRIFMQHRRNNELSALHGPPTANKVTMLGGKAGKPLAPFRWIAFRRIP